MDKNKSINEINFELAIAAGKIGTWVRDLSTDLITQSPITSQILGHGEGETIIPFEYLFTFTHEEDVPKFRAPLDQSINSGEPFDIEFRIWRPDGKLRWITVRGKSIKDKTGKPVQIVGVMFDITEKKQAAERFRLLTEYSPDAILVEINHQLVYANPAAIHLLGMTQAHRLTGYSFLDFTTDKSRGAVVATYKSIHENHPASSLFDLQVRRIDGACIDIQAVFGFLFWDGQAATQIMLRDLTELKKTQRQVQKLSERLELIIEGTGEGIWEWDIVENTYTFSGGFSKIIGRNESKFNTSTIDWYNIIHPDDVSRVELTFQESLKTKAPVYGCEFRVKAADKGWKWVRARGVVVEQNESGKALIMAGTLTDITTKKESDELAWKHANLDPLTSLPNRRLFHECLEFELQKNKHTGRQVALLFIDLDGFKRVNDFYGHDAGDVLLIETARRIKESLRKKGSTVARIGGDEYIVILSDLARIAHVEYVCSRILDSLSQPFTLGENIGYVSASIGISLYPLDAQEPEELIRKADQAMHVAKENGKNRFAYFTKELDEKAHERLQIMNDLRVALSLNQFAIHYQPIFDLRTHQLVKAEALLRWVHPTMGNISPAVFIPLAEELGLITPIGNWMFKEAVKFCKQCETCLTGPFQISINMSPIQFMAAEKEINWMKYLADAELSGEKIVIEITEGVLLNASEKVLERFNEFRNAGIHIALDDFGTGYSSLSYLQKFDIDYIKIDKSFVQDITVNQGSRTIAETVIVMAHKLGKEVIAEGIETQEQLAYLAQENCDYGQGFLFSKAVSADQFLALSVGAF